MHVAFYLIHTALCW